MKFMSNTGVALLGVCCSVFGFVLCVGTCMSAEAQVPKDTLVTGTIETRGLVPPTFEARGTITGALTDRQKVWVVVRKKKREGTNLHWPKGRMAGPVFVTNVIFADGGRWTASVYENSPEGFELLLVIVDDLGQTQIRSWGKNADDTGNWEGMPTIAGMTILANTKENLTTLR